MVWGWMLREKPLADVNHFCDEPRADGVLYPGSLVASHRWLACLLAKNNVQMADFVQQGPHVTPAAFLLIYQLCASVVAATRPRFTAYFTVRIYFQTDKDVGIQQVKNMRALAFGIVDDIGNRCQGHYSVSSSFHAKVNTPLGSAFSSRRTCSLT